MISLNSIPLVIALLFLVVVIAFLVYICGIYKAQADNLKSDVMFRDTEIKILQENNKKKERKLYTFESGVNRIEDVVHCITVDQHLKLTQISGSVHFISIPAEYKLIIQDRLEEEN